MDSIASLLHFVFWVLVLFLALSFFGISIQTIVNSPVGQENLAYLFNLLSQTWQMLIQVWAWSTAWIRP